MRILFALIAVTLSLTGCTTYNTTPAPTATTTTTYTTPVVPAATRTSVSTTSTSY